MTTTPDFRAGLARLVDLYYALGGDWSPHGYTDTWNDALVEARAALATPPPELPSLKKQAYDALDTYIYGEPDPKDKERTYNTIRQALEALPND